MTSRSPSPNTTAPRTSSSPATDALSGIPPLTTHKLSTAEEQTAALKLVADSIAQQRQSASSALIFHPLSMALYAVLLGLVSKATYHSPADSGLLLTTCAGLTMACLVAVRMLTGEYINHAERITWAFTTPPSGAPQDIFIGSHYGRDLIGALILRLEPTNIPASSKTLSSRKRKHKGGRAFIRAWTVAIRYREKGVGTELLEEAVRYTRDRLGGTAEIGFAKEHANSKMVLPRMFNRGFRAREARAQRALEAVLEAGGGWKR